MKPQVFNIQIGEYFVRSHIRLSSFTNGVYRMAKLYGTFLNFDQGKREIIHLNNDMDNTLK